MEELDAVAGGSRDWYVDGCVATVEPGSDCLGTDGGCSFCNVDYSHGPSDMSCIFCGARYTHAHGQGTFGSDWTIEYACRSCHRWFTYDKQTGQMVEMEPRW